MIIAVIHDNIPIKIASLIDIGIFIIEFSTSNPFAISKSNAEAL